MIAIKRLGIILALALTAAVVPAAPSSASVESASVNEATANAALACVLYAYTPYRTSNWIEADGGRSGCTNVVNLHVRIRQDISWWPDQTLAEVYVTTTNYNAHLSFPCLGFGTNRKVFTEAIVGSQKVQSSRVTLPCT